jgi:hypothetical protein
MFEPIRAAHAAIIMIATASTYSCRQVLHRFGAISWCIVAAVSRCTNTSRSTVVVVAIKIVDCCRTMIVPILIKNILSLFYL